MAILYGAVAAAMGYSLDNADDDDDNEDDDTNSSGDSSAGSGSGGGHYNPDEPRIPAGQPGGGQWTTGGTVASETAPDSGSLPADNVRNDTRTAPSPTQPTQVTSASSASGSSSGNGGGASNTQLVAGTSTPVSNETVLPATTVRLSDGSVVTNPVTGSPILMPSNVSLSENIKFGETIADLPSKLDDSSSGDNDLSFRETAMTAAFIPNGSMDYQRIYSNQTDSNGNPLINRDYIDFGNYNYGAVGAAAGYSLSQLLDAGAIVNARNILTPNVGMVLNPFDATDTTPWLSNPRNDMFITMGYNAYKAGKIKASQIDKHP